VRPIDLRPDRFRCETTAALLNETAPIRVPEQRTGATPTERLVLAGLRLRGKFRNEFVGFGVPLAVLPWGLPRHPHPPTSSAGGT